MELRRQLDGQNCANVTIGSREPVQKSQTCWNLCWGDRQLDPWGLMISLPGGLLGEFQASERGCVQNQNGQFLRMILEPDL